MRTEIFRKTNRTYSHKLHIKHSEFCFVLAQRKMLNFEDSVAYIAIHIVSFYR